MHKYFKKLGPKSKTVVGQEAEEAEVVLKEFKSMSGKFIKYENWRQPESGTVKIDDDEVLKKIKIDLVRRMESSKQWLEQKPKASSATKSKKSSPKREPSPSKEDSDDDDDTDDDSSQKSSSRTLRKKEAVNYANSGAELGTGSSSTSEVKQVEAASPKKNSSKKTPDRKNPSKSAVVHVFTGKLYDLSQRATKLRDADIIISLRESKYRDAMIPYFQQLGTVRDTEKEREAAEEIFEMLKATGARFFKPTSRATDCDLDELDDALATRSINIDLRRRLDTTWWLEEEVNSSPSPKKKSSNVKAKAPKPSKPARNIIASLSDPEYREIMEKEFKKLGAKTGPDKREAQFAEDVFNRLKREGAVFCRRENHRDHDSTPTQMDDDEAFKKIRTDMQRRMESAKRWLAGGVNSKSYAGTSANIRDTSPPKAVLAHKPAKKRALPVHVHRPSPTPKKKAKIDRVNAATEPKRGSQRLARSMNTSTEPESRTHRTAAASRDPNAPKVTICLGDHFIDTEVDALIQSSRSYLPDHFDPNSPPTVPTYSQQIYIPGNEVYARWLNDDDPASYGTWYPGYVYSSKLAPTNNAGADMPKLLYHVKFHDGAEGLNLNTEDLMMREQYEEWLQDLLTYYELPQLGNAFTSRIPQGARVYAQWNDPTDPDAHGSWLQGTVRHVHDSRRYHVRFDNGDEDDDMDANHVVLDGVYVQLLAEKMKNGGGSSVRRGSAVSSTTRAALIHVPTTRAPMNNNGSRAQTASRSSNKPTTLKKITYEIATEDLTVSSNGSSMDELRCDEVFAGWIKPSESVQHFHYGIYVKAKPWKEPPQQQVEMEMIAPLLVDEQLKDNANKEDVSMEELRCQETLV